jgi:hypothetical protein
MPHTANMHDPISEGRRKEIFHWLSPVIPSANFHGALEIRTKGTGVWFIQNKAFEEWFNTADSVVWIHGKRKSGKLVASALVTNFWHSWLWQDRPEVSNLP